MDNQDDPDIPASTFRVWVSGTFFLGAGGFINQFFSIRNPGIDVGANVAQLLCVLSALTSYERQLRVDRV